MTFEATDGNNRQQPPHNLAARQVDSGVVVLKKIAKGFQLQPPGVKSLLFGWGAHGELLGIKIENYPHPDTGVKYGFRVLGYDTCGRIEFRPECGIAVNSKDKSLPPLEKLGIHKSRAPSFPNYATLEARLRSYDMWPIALKLKPNTLSEAGFFYTGKGDQTICFHCGGGLKDWEESDEPWVEHARWFSKCNFVLLIKGKDFVDEVCGRKVTKGKSKSEENLNQTTGTESTKKEEKKPSQERDSKGDEDSNSNKAEHTSVCKICYTDEVGVVFLPCGHLVACVKCALSLTTCAVCRQDVTATVRVFLS